MRALLALLPAAWLLAALPLRAQNTELEAWLRYAPPVNTDRRAEYAQMPSAIVTLDSSPMAVSAREDLERGVRSMPHITLRIEPSVPACGSWNRSIGTRASN